MGPETQKKIKNKTEWGGTDKVGPVNDNFFSTLLGHVVIRVIGKFFFLAQSDTTTQLPMGHGEGAFG